MTDALGSNLSHTDDEDGMATLQQGIAPPAPARAARVKAQGLPQTRRIVLEESEHIPPTGLFIGVNGRGYLLRAGEEANVPQSVIEVLNNATMSVPAKDPTTAQVVGYRDRQRYPFRYV
jgi:hypothetical protein